LKRLAVIGALSVAVALTGPASGASDTRWRLLSSQHARGEVAVARAAAAVRDPRGIAVRFHGEGTWAWACERGGGGSLRRIYGTGFHAVPFVRQDTCVIEATARHEWRASVAIYEAMR
jgi:hypothetical protein